MDLRRVKTVLINSWYHFIHSMETWVDLVWNPVLQIVVFAFIGLSLSNAGSREIARFIMLGMIFWNVVWVGQYAIALGALWEIWSQSFNSMLVTPITLEEFLLGHIIGGIAKSLIAIVVTAGFGYWIYHISILELSFMLPVYFLVLSIFSWGIGMMVLALILRLGRDVASFSWSLIFLVQPFGAIFYPVSVLPKFMQQIAWLLPTSYAFEAMRYQLTTGQTEPGLIVKSAIVSLIYFVLGYVIIKRQFKQSKESGMLAKIED